MIGDRIKKRRKELGWTMEELAKKMGYSTKSTISLIESGKRDITQSKAVQFSQVLGVSISYLMGWEEKDASKPEQKSGDASAPSNDLVEKAIELYNKFEELTPDKQREFLYFLEFLQSKP